MENPLGKNEKYARLKWKMRSLKMVKYVLLKSPLFKIKNTLGNIENPLGKMEKRRVKMKNPLSKNEKFAR
jgi:hypothetical protein